MLNRCQIMGIVNVTPDSFSDGGKYYSVEAAIQHGMSLVKAGADMLDIGGESTRPGAETVSVDEEYTRVIPVISGLRGRTGARLSVDTRKPEIATAAIAAGATIWNDVSALAFGASSVSSAASLDCDIVLMHARGEPKTMQDDPHYDDVVSDVCAFFEERIEACVSAGISKKRLILDPGIGFGKTLGHNLELFRGLHKIVAMGLPVLVGASRKRFIAALDGDAGITARLGGSIAAAIAAQQAGATIVRVHDVSETRQALRIVAAISP